MQTFCRHIFVQKHIKKTQNLDNQTINILVKTEHQTQRVHITYFVLAAFLLALALSLELIC